MEILRVCLEERFLICYCGDKAFNIDKNPKYDGYQRRLASIMYKSFDKEASAT